MKKYQFLLEYCSGWRCVESKVDSERLHFGQFVISPFRSGQANTVGIAVLHAQSQAKRLNNTKLRANVK
jgi:hypothetical protein